MKTVLHNNEICSFDPDKHIYSLSDKTILPSVTTYSKKYFKEFDSDKIATAYAIKNNLNKQDVLNMWEEKRNKSATFGTTCHLYAETNLLRLKSHQDPIEPSNKFEEAILNKLVDLNYTHDLVGQEEILFSRELNLAGTADLLLGMGDVLFICDWKTNKEIKTQNKYQSGLDVLYTYPDCEKTKYQLQLNLYLKIILTEKYFAEYTKYEMLLFHVTETGVIDINILKFPRYVFDKI